jgi:hypothetical protein
MMATGWRPALITQIKAAPDVGDSSVLTMPCPTRTTSRERSLRYEAIPSAAPVTPVTAPTTARASVTDTRRAL